MLSFCLLLLFACLCYFVSLAGAVISCRDKHMFVTTNTSVVVTKVCLSRQTKFCCDNNFVMTSLLLSRQTCVCHDKTRLLLRQKYACGFLLRQAYFRHIKRHVTFVFIRKMLKNDAVFLFVAGVSVRSVRCSWRSVPSAAKTSDSVCKSLWPTQKTPAALALPHPSRSPDSGTGANKC